MLINNAVLTGSFTVNGVNYITNTPSTGSNTFVGTQTISGSTLITGSLQVTGSIATTGTITAQTLVVQTVSSSIEYASGSNIFGNLMTNVQQMTGSLRVTGSIVQTGANTTSSFSGNVGINTTSPSYSLDVSGSGRFTGALQANSSAANVIALDLSANTTGGVRQRLLNQSGSGLYNFQIGSNITVNNAFEIAASTATDGTTYGSPVFKILNTGAATFSGSVGIGVTAGGLGGTLDVSGSNNVYAAIFKGGTTTGQSYGPYFRAGTNSSDIAFQVRDITEANLYFKVRGDGNVGIGVSPSYRLDVSSGASGIVLNLDSTNAYNAETGIQMATNRAKISAFLNGTGGTPGSSLRFYTMPDGGSVTERIRIDSNGCVNIGGVAGYGLLDICGQTSGVAANICRIGNVSGVNNGLIISKDTSNNYSYSFGTLGTGTVSATSGVLSASSDKNLKNDDGGIENALNKVLQLNPRYFHWKEESGLPTDIRQLGFYAQEVNEALGEEVANTPKDENDKWGIYDRGLIAMLTKAIQEQQATITSLQEQITDLKAIVATK